MLHKGRSTGSNAFRKSLKPIIDYIQDIWQFSSARWKTAVICWWCWPCSASMSIMKTCSDCFILVDVIAALTHLDRLKVWGKQIKVAPSKHSVVQMPKEGQPVSVPLPPSIAVDTAVDSYQLSIVEYSFSIRVFCLPTCCRTRVSPKTTLTQRCTDSRNQTPRIITTFSLPQLRCTFPTFREYWKRVN